MERQRGLHARGKKKKLRSYFDWIYEYGEDYEIYAEISREQMANGVRYEDTALGEIPRLDGREALAIYAVHQIRGETPLSDIYAWLDEHEIDNRQTRCLVVDAVRASEQASAAHFKKKMKKASP